MILRLSSFVHLVPVGGDRVLVIHALSHLRMVVDRELAQMIAFFATPREVADDDGKESGAPPAFGALRERGILVETSVEAELASVGNELGAHHGRDPAELLEQFRRKAKEGGESYWAAGSALGEADLAPAKTRLDIVLMGDCDVHMEADFLRREARARGVDLRVAATFPDDLDFVSEHKHDAVFIGALRARHAIAEPWDPSNPEPPFALFIAQARAVIEGLRRRTSAPILIDNLPEPTVQPLGLAERGLFGHRNRFRLANLGLAEIVETYPDVHVVDMAAILGGAGAERLNDDGQTGYTHFGSPGWMLQRAEAEKAATHGLFPDIAPLAHSVGGDPYGREAVSARAHVDALITVTGTDRKKCVIVDLDGTLWPGVLAETGSPFAWAPDVSGPFSYVGLWFGLHEALKSLKQRGVLLACVSKNDESVVRDLWRYDDHYPRERLLTPEDFATWRVNWDDKAENIRSIADELGFALDAFVFIDDHPVERERVRGALPEVEVWGEDLFALRRRLLTDPRLMVPRLTEESTKRTETVKAQLGRDRARTASTDEDAFLASLKVTTDIRRLQKGDPLGRIEELFQRTTQCNTTGLKPSLARLEALAAGPDSGVYALWVKDRFGDHGLVGACVVEGPEIIGFALSCRVLGLKVDRRFVESVLLDLAGRHPEAIGRIVETARNLPVRNLYRDNGFSLGGDGAWRRKLELIHKPALAG
ncbi:MAG TPA: HAD-IIIC family phosphatase [Caulobacteraceae bacterium]|jgi:FkbH-like protein|nr:HAD-IIIC family phosphatase [Caulobacteraceae bacterium]